MRDLISAAFGIAREHSRATSLVRVFGAGLDADGRVEFERASYLSRWEFAFFTDSGHALTVTWLAEVYKISSPWVQEHAGNVDLNSQRIELAHFGEDAELLPDSDEVARVVADAGVRWSGSDGDMLVYTRAGTQDIVDAIAEGNIWRGLADGLLPLL